MQIRADAVARPDDDVFRVHETFRIDAAARTHRHQPRGGRAFAAKRALHHCRTEAVKKRIAAVQAVDQSLMAKVAVRHDCLRAVLVDNALPARCDLVECVVPADTFELFRTLRPGATHRIQHAIRMVMTFFVILQFYAQAAAGHRAVLIAFYADQATVFDFKKHGAGIGAIVWASTEMFCTAKRRHEKVSV